MHRVRLSLFLPRCQSDNPLRISSLHTFWSIGNLSLFFRWRLRSANLVFTSLILNLLFNFQMTARPKLVSALEYLSLDGTLMKATRGHIHMNYEVASHIVHSNWISGNLGIRLLAVVSKYAYSLFPTQWVSILTCVYDRQLFLILMIYS